MLRLAIDFDGTLVEGTPLRWRLGARAFLAQAHFRGDHLILWSRRNSPYCESPQAEQEAEEFYRTGNPPAGAIDQWDLYREMRDFLVAQGVWRLFAEVWTAPGKPQADIFFDDRAEFPNWTELLEPQPQAVTRGR